jgi:two-component system, sensor histidine kinase and response regulator
VSAEPIKFLLVDDTEANLIALEVLLRREELQVLKASSGAEALELLLVHDVALAFIDVHMPNMDGFELAELMRGTERTKHVPIIFVTAGAKDPTRVFKGYESGAVDFLFKPIEPHVLKGKADVFFELYRQRRTLSDALRLNEMFVGILGHDLRNPLGAVLMGARLLEQQLQDAGQRRTLQRMMSAGQRMTDMIEQLLDLTRARLAGGIGFIGARQPLDVGSLVQRAAEELRATHAAREMLVSVAGDCTLTGDPDRLLQLFSNLIGNALLHGTSDAPVRIDVEGRDQAIVVSVRNRGTIPPELIPTIFDPFRGRQEATSSRGLGLGLFIAREIALAHGGVVEVESSSDTGTAITVQFSKAAAK